MKCSKCGAEIKEGSLYCEHCGEDIHIVPDYDPQLDFNIAQTMTQIVAEVNNHNKQYFLELEQEKVRQEKLEQEELEQEKLKPEKLEREKFKQEEIEDEIKTKVKKQPKRKKKGKWIMIAGIFSFSFIGLIAIGILLLWQNQSYDYQLSTATEWAKRGQYEKAIQYYNRALELDNQDIEVRFSLAEVYYKKGNKVEYEYLLRDIIHEEDASQEQLERAYGKLITIYRDRGEYNTINEILLSCESTDIQNTYQSFIARPPEFSYQEGYYTEMVPLKLSSTTPGKIYYTFDGTDPDENSLLYTAPITLDSGDHVVKAIFLNEYGVFSESVRKEYHITVTLANPPELSVISGEYYTPIMIEVLNEDTEDVYYTTDGSVPNIHSNHYNGPIPMPLGKSQYCFAFVQDDGTISEVAQRSFQLKLNTEITAEQAVTIMKDYMISIGKLLNQSGQFELENPARYIYEFLYVVKLKNVDDVYIIAEVYRDADGTINRTGSYYAVNAYNGSIYKLQMEGNNNYSLVEILIDSQEG